MLTQNQKRVIITLAILIGVWHAHRATAADAVILEVAAGHYDRANVVVTLDLPPSLRNYKHFTLTRLDNGQAVSVQVDCTAKKPRASWIIRDK